MVVNNQYDHGTDHSDQQAVKIQSRDAGSAESTKEPAANYGAKDPQKNVENQTLALFINNLAPDEASKQTKHNPGKK